MLRGWIGADYEDKEHLENLGIILGEYDEANGEFKDCIVSEEAFRKLEPYWFIRYIWHLQ
jgi:hypothetical protein